MPRKMQGRKMVGGQSQANIPLKVNTAGVIPVIFASPAAAGPVVIAGFRGSNQPSKIRDGSASLILEVDQAYVIVEQPVTLANLGEPVSI